MITTMNSFYFHFIKILIICSNDIFGIVFVNGSALVKGNRWNVGITFNKRDVLKKQQRKYFWRNLVRIENKTKEKENEFVLKFDLNKKPSKLHVMYACI